MELLFYCNQQSSVLEQPVPLTNAVNQQRRKRLYSVVRNGAAALDLQRFLVILHVPVVNAMMIYVANLIQAWNVSVKVVNSVFDGRLKYEMVRQTAGFVRTEVVWLCRLKVHVAHFTNA